MARCLGLWLLALAAAGLVAQAATLYASVAQLIELRHKIMVNPDDLRQRLCANANRRESTLFWREAGSWVDACLSQKKTGGLPRLWRITVTHNYRMLFLREVPITFAIVIKR